MHKSRLLKKNLKVEKNFKVTEQDICQRWDRGHTIHAYIGGHILSKCDVAEDLR